MELRVRAPAKINLGLEILARREDGYHEIDTIFLPLDLSDELSLCRTPTPGVGLRVEGAALSAGSDNLAYRAAVEMQAACGLEGGIDIRLEKRIPLAAGLGGGSSDAAAVLRGIEQLSGRALPAEQRHALARKLGADVPFFLDPRPSRASGIGDVLTPIRDAPALDWLLVAFPFGISTPRAYAAASAQLTLPRRGSSIAALLGPSGVASRPPNDLEHAARRWHPEIGSSQDVLMDCGATIAGMTGSGPTVYGLFESWAHAQRAAERASERLPQGARILMARSPASS